jgi:RNA polymerase sigma factor (sigma-70 family)
MNIQDERSVFIDLETKEKNLFLKILSLSTHKEFFVKCLTDLCQKNGIEQSIENNYDNSYNVLKFNDVLKVWFETSLKIIKNKTIEEDNYRSIVKNNEYQIWSDEVISKHNELIKTKNEFAIANLGLIKSIVNKLRFNSKLDVPTEDLIQEGFFGLMRAIEKFDYTRGLKFSTYCVDWIKHVCRRYIFDKNVVIRTPAHTSTIRDSIFNFEMTYQAKHDSKPSDEEIQAGTGYSKLTLDNIVKPFIIFNIDKPIEIEDGKQISLYEKLEDKSDIGVYNYIAQKQIENKILKAINLLSDRERKIIFDRFGFDNKEDKSLQEIGNELNLSREGIRLIQIQALNKIKAVLKQEDI